jgi:hypothetical protein
MSIRVTRRANTVKHAGIDYTNQNFSASMQLQIFRKRIVDRLQQVPGGITAPWWVRADDGLSYIVKDEAPNVASVRASEYLWLSVARLIGLPAPYPEIILDGQGRELFGTRREQSAVDANVGQMALLAGRVTGGGSHLSRIYAFDLFSANWDRHPGNYLVLDDGGGSLAVFAIDFSHVTVHPGLTPAPPDPIVTTNNATRMQFPAVIQPYGADLNAALEIADRLESLPIDAMNAILTEIPDEWLPQSDKASVVAWWNGKDRIDRIATLKQGLQNGTLI